MSPAATQEQPPPCPIKELVERLNRLYEAIDPPIAHMEKNAGTTLTDTVQS